MTNDPVRRRSIRIKDYDYGHIGAYFVTICAHQRIRLFGDVVDGAMRLNRLGEIVRETWEGLPAHYPNVELDSFVVMPNHIHMVIKIVGAGFKPALMSDKKPYILPEIVRALKTFSARRINEYRVSPGAPVWQRNYYEHVIRNEKSLNKIREYIANNPMQWEFDRENPARAGFKPAPTRHYCCFQRSLKTFTAPPDEKSSLPNWTTFPSSVEG